MTFSDCCGLKTPITWAENWLKDIKKGCIHREKMELDRPLSVYDPPMHQAFCRV